jgi:hypothetical protein
MTLCIAWKNGNEIKFASDSRISTDDDHYADIAIKIMEVPLKINNPTPVETGIEETIYNYKLGMCYCGDTLNALLIKETIFETLQKLQLIPGYGDFSLEAVCRTISKFFENTSDQLRNGADWDPEVEFLIGGFCPRNKEIVVYKLELVDYHDHYEVLCNEVLTEEDDFIILGTGASKAEEIITDSNIPIGNKFINVLRDVCHDETEPSVGGYLQYGHFENLNFEILGVQDYAIDDKDDIEFLNTYRGTLLYKGKFEHNYSDFHIAATFITPFEDEIQAYFKRKLID